MTEGQSNPAREQAYAYLYAGDYPRALQAFEAHFKAFPLAEEAPVVIRDYVNQLALAGQSEQALVILDGAIALHPHYAEFLVSRGQILLNLGQRLAARDAFAAATTIEPEIRCQVYTLVLTLTMEARQFDSLPAMMEQASRVHCGSDDCEFQLMLANAGLEYDFYCRGAARSPVTREQLAKACGLFARLDEIRLKALPNHVLREAARLRDLYQFETVGLPPAAAATITAPAFGGAAVVMLIKDEGDIIFYHLAWHYGQGLRKFVILNNGSTDQTAAEIRRFQATFPEATLYLIDDPVVAHYQGRKTTAAAHFAHHMFGVDWVIPLDGDEFLCAHGLSLEAALSGIAAAGHDYVLAHRCDYAMSSADPAEEENPARRTNYRRNDLTPCPKVLVRFRDGLRIEEGNHGVHAVDARRLSAVSGLANGLVIRHFPLRSKDHIRRKFINGGRALEAAVELDSSQGNHWRGAYAHYLQGGEAFIDAYYRDNILDPERLVFDPLPWPAD